jgi:hypothetical protein
MNAPGNKGWIGWGALLTMLTLSAVTSRGERLRWDNPNKPGEIESFTVLATGPLPSATVRKMIVRTNEVDLASLLALAPPGRYLLSVVGNGTNKLASDRSKPIRIMWGRPPFAATQARAPACDKVLFARENRGVVYQTLQDKAHAYAASSFKAETSGKVCKIAVNLRKFHEPAGELTFYVWSNYKGKPAALLATSATGVDAAQIVDGWCEAEVHFAPIAGETYWVGFASPTANPSNNLLWIGGGHGARCYSADGITWVFASAEGMNVRLYGE